MVDSIDFVFNRAGKLQQDRKLIAEMLRTFFFHSLLYSTGTPNIRRKVPHVQLVGILRDIQSQIVLSLKLLAPVARSGLSRVQPTMAADHIPFP
jgi:hypothetical protein